jgi:hypothetical protein
MAELAIVVGMLAALLSVPAAVFWLPWEVVLEGAVVATLVGLWLGVPAGLLYHVRLYLLARPRPAAGGSTLCARLGAGRRRRPVVATEVGSLWA